jgi:hypothetical protein
VDDALLVRGLQSLGDLLRDRERFPERKRAGGEALPQVFALDELHDEDVAGRRGEKPGISSNEWITAMPG